MATIAFKFFPVTLPITWTDVKFSQSYHTYCFVYSVNLRDHISFFVRAFSKFPAYLSSQNRSIL